MASPLPSNVAVEHGIKRLHSRHLILQHYLQDLVILGHLHESTEIHPPWTTAPMIQPITLSQQSSAQQTRDCHPWCSHHRTHRIEQLRIPSLKDSEAHQNRNSRYLVKQDNDLVQDAFMRFRACVYLFHCIVQQEMAEVIHTHQCARKSAFLCGLNLQHRPLAQVDK
jgi:hypothetical protein